MSLQNFLSFVINKRNLIIKTASIIAVILVLSFTAISTKDSSTVDKSWASNFTLLNNEDLEKATTEFLDAYKNNNTEELKALCSASAMKSITEDTSEKDSFVNSLIDVFGGEKMVDKEMKKAITSFADSIYDSPIISYSIDDTKIRDNTGTVNVTLEKKENPMIMQEYDVSETVRTATYNYSEEHEKELIDTYKENQNDDEITQLVVKGIYSEILDELKSEYSKEKHVKDTLEIKVTLTKTGKLKVLDVSFIEQAA